MKKILVCETDPAIRTLICRFLSAKQNYQIQSAEDGKNALSLFKEFDPDLVILDTNLPDINGFQLWQAMQESTNVCVLMLTSRDDLDNRLKMLSQSADDSMTKPFALEELAVRVEMILRGIRDHKPPKQKILSFGNLTIDPERREVKLNGSLVDLSALEFNILYFFASNPGKEWTRADLIREVWEHDFVGDPRIVDVHIGQLRKKVAIDMNQPALLDILFGGKGALTFGSLSIDPERLNVVVDGRAIDLPEHEFWLLYILASNPKEVCTRRTLVEAVWGTDALGDLWLADLHIGRLRQKIETDPSQPTLILTVPGVGFKFVPPPGSDDDSDQSTTAP